MKEEDITQVIYKVSYGRSNYEFECNKVGTVVVNNEIKDYPIKDDIWKIFIKKDGKKLRRSPRVHTQEGCYPDTYDLSITFANLKKPIFNVYFTHYFAKYGELIELKEKMNKDCKDCKNCQYRYYGKCGFHHIPIEMVTIRKDGHRFCDDFEKRSK